ncbi:MAG: cation diffusion facilitator family transporter, partial [Candidatus Rifleibacteriota bacterium]
MHINSEQILKDNGEIKRVTIAGMIVNILLACLKIFAGYTGQSQSVIADGFHSLTDCSTDIAVLIGLKYWNEPPDGCHPYGHRRIETITAAFIGIVLAIAGLLLCWQAIIKFRSGEFLIPCQTALFVALFSVVVKEVLYHWTMKVGKRVNSQALKANAWHHRTDSLSSIGVAVAIAFSIYSPEWAIMDSIAAFAVGIFI